MTIQKTRADYEKSPEEWIAFQGELEGYSSSSWGRVRNELTGHIFKGSLNYNGIGTPYHRVKIRGRKHLTHRLVLSTFFPHEANDDQPFCDHIDGNSLNNNVWNLRWASNSQNQMNALWSNNTSGYKGISYCNQNNVWVATIQINKKEIQKKYSTFYDAWMWRRDMVTEHYDAEFYKE